MRKNGELGYRDKPHFLFSVLDWPVDSLIPACSQHPAYNSRPSTEHLGLASDKDGEGCVLQTDTQCFAYFSETLSMEDVTICPENKGQVQKG